MTGLFRHNRGDDGPDKAVVVPARLTPEKSFSRPPRTLISRRIFAPDRATGRGPLVPRTASPSHLAIRRLLAIVGSRAASRAGCRRTQELAAMASEHGHTIVSGGALGIDAAAGHQGALAAGAPTFSGPRLWRRRRLPGPPCRRCSAEIAATGRPSLRVSARHAPPREAVPLAQPDCGVRWPRRCWWSRRKRESGALVTAQARDGPGASLLLAVPGSAGTDALIASGQARPVCDGAELLAGPRGRSAEAAARPARAAPFDSSAVRGRARRSRSRAA